MCFRHSGKVNGVRAAKAKGIRFVTGLALADVRLDGPSRADPEASPSGSNLRDSQSREGT